MLEMLRAHGLDAGPTQRPLTAGAITGLLAELPALAVLHAFASLESLGAAAHVSVGAAVLLHAATMTLAGAGYGLLFRRAANDVRGGWLFGMAYGYLIWQSVTVPLLQWLPHEPLLLGRPAAGMLLGHLAWGLILGLTFVRVHRPLQVGLQESGHGATGAGGASK